MTILHQSYFELKKGTDEEFARRTLLYNLKCLKNNVRATARAIISSSSMNSKRFSSFLSSADLLQLPFQNLLHCYLS